MRNKRKPLKPLQPKARGGVVITLIPVGTSDEDRRIAMQKARQKARNISRIEPITNYRSKEQ